MEQINRPLTITKSVHLLSITEQEIGRALSSSEGSFTSLQLLDKLSHKVADSTVLCTLLLMENAVLQTGLYLRPYWVC